MIVSGKNTKLPLTIIIVNYNVKDFLLQCLHSIERASATIDTEVIVVDNNSTDSSITYLRPLFPTVEFIELQENIGFGLGNNIGITKAAGKYTLLLNPDTILADDTLTMMYDFMEQHPEIGIAGCKILNGDGTFQVQCRRGFPTPWASFCKLFGLQRLFPKSPLFARYNQTFRSEDETYYVDAVIGAFMFCRTDVLQSVGGFDSDFFMYGEDLDLCYRVSLMGLKICYYHETTTIHFKGESTRRSSMNEVKVFYSAMEIFARKHYGHSLVFLNILRFGIWLRSLIAYLSKNKRISIILLGDCLVINTSLVLATKIRFGHYLGFPQFAYPTVFIVITLLFALSMLAVEGYYAGKSPIRKLISGLMVSFFTLSSITYFFKEYAFSRGVLLMTITFTLIAGSLMRFALIIRDKLIEKDSNRKIALLGITPQTIRIIKELHSSKSHSFEIAGVITSKSDNEQSELSGLSIIGNIEYLAKIISEFHIREIIVTEPTIDKSKLMSLASTLPNVRFHFADTYENIIVSRIVADVTNAESLLPKIPINSFRNRVVKRGIDILISIFLLTGGLPLVFLLTKNIRFALLQIYRVLIGNQSLIGLYPLESSKKTVGKIGMISLAHLNNPELLSVRAIEELNRFYTENYSFSLDLDIFLKFIWRK
jgi:GT2 family glycosyltransferase